MHNNNYYYYYAVYACAFLVLCDKNLHVQYVDCLSAINMQRSRYMLTTVRHCSWLWSTWERRTVTLSSLWASTPMLMSALWVKRRPPLTIQTSRVPLVMVLTWRDLVCVPLLARKLQKIDQNPLPLLLCLRVGKGEMAVWLILQQTVPYCLMTLSIQVRVWS